MSSQDGESKATNPTRRLSKLSLFNNINIYIKNKERNKEKKRKTETKKTDGMPSQHVDCPVRINFIRPITYDKEPD